MTKLMINAGGCIHAVKDEDVKSFVEAGWTDYEEPEEEPAEEQAEEPEEEPEKPKQRRKKPESEQ